MAWGGVGGLGGAHSVLAAPPPCREETFVISRRAMLTASIPLGLALFGLGHGSLAASAPQPITLRTSTSRTVSGLLAVPAKLPAPAVLLIHGSGGLNDVIKSFADDFVRYGFLALALDLFDGRTATNEAARS